MSQNDQSFNEYRNRDGEKYNVSSSESEDSQSDYTSLNQSITEDNDFLWPEGLEGILLTKEADKENTQASIDTVKETENTHIEEATEAETNHLKQANVQQEQEQVQQDIYIAYNIENTEDLNMENNIHEERREPLEARVVINDHNGRLIANPAIPAHRDEKQIEDYLKQKEAEMKEITRRLSELSFKQEGYIPTDEQAQHIKLLELAEYQVRSETNKKISKLLDILNPTEEAAKAAIAELKEEVKNEVSAQEEIQISKYAEIKKAQSIASKYKKGAKKPTIKDAPENYQYTPQRTSPKEIISVTGKFNPADLKADFTHMWSKLTGYGQLHHFTEEEYINALRYILEGDAYEAYINMVDDNHGLDYIINYFSHVHGRKRSVLQDRNAVDNFTRHKNEPLDVCMHRSLIAIDKLSHLYTKHAWPEMRNNLRRGILAQVIHPDTWKYVRYEENEILEKSGLHVDMDKVIEMADRYETFHNKVPTKDISTAFQVASGGFTQNVNQLKDENLHLKREKYDEKQRLTELVQEILANPIKVSASEDRSRQMRDNRLADRMNERRQRRDAVFDKNRSLSQESVPSRPPTPTRVTFRKPTGPQSLPPSLQRKREIQERARSISAGSRDSARSPDTRVTPYIPPKPFEKSGREENFPPRQNNYDGNRQNYGQNQSYGQNQNYGQNKNYNNGQYRRDFSNNRNYQRDYSGNRSYQRDYSNSRNYNRSPARGQYRFQRNQSTDSRNGRNNSREGYNNYRQDRSNSRDRNYSGDRRQNYGNGQYRRQNYENYDFQRNGARTPPMEKSVLVTINGAAIRVPASENEEYPPHEY